MTGIKPELIGVISKQTLAKMKDSQKLKRKILMKNMTGLGLNMMHF